MNERIEDPKLYRKLSEPFNGADEANAALLAFLTEMRELRTKHRIAEVTFAVAVNVDYGGEDGESSGMSVGHFGDESKAEVMAAYALGHFAAEHREMVNKAASGRPKKTK